jgi:cell wall assembly regulator SMI1
MRLRRGPARLSAALLERLESLWREQGAPLVDHLQPGMPSDQAARLVEPCGLRLPSEAALWWEWRDGVPSERPREMGGPAFFFLPLAEAVEQYGASRRVAHTAARDENEADRLWDPAWLPITMAGYGAVVACDCSVAHDEPTPIRVVDWAHNERSNVPVAESFGEMVGWWIEAIESGAWRYDSGLGRWEIDHSRLRDSELALTRLV